MIIAAAAAAAAVTMVVATSRTIRAFSRAHTSPTNLDL